MITQRNAITASDDIHICKPPIVQYKELVEKDTDENAIKEDKSSQRFDKLFNEYREAFRHAYKTYINHIQDKNISFDNIPYFDGKNMKLIEAQFNFSNMEHCFGIPYKADEKTKALLKKLVDNMNKSNENKKIDFSFNLTDDERYFLFEVDKAIEEYVSKTNTKGFQIAVENIYERLNKLQSKYENNIEVQRELMYQASKIHKMLSNNTRIRYLNKDNEKKYFDSTFNDEACRLIIKQLTKKSNNLDILNLKKMDKSTNKMVRIIRRNISSFEGNPDKNTLAIYLGSSERQIKIKNQVIEKLAGKYLRDVITDDKILEYASNYMIEDTITGKYILDGEFIKSNIISEKATILKDYDLNKLYTLIKNPDETTNKEEIIDNINNLVGVWRELERRVETGNIDDLEITKDLIDLKYQEMLSNKNYQVEFTRKSINKEIRDKLRIEINTALMNSKLGVKGIRNYDILNSLFNDENHDYIKELSDEVNESSYNKLEEKLTELELKTRRTYFEMEALYKGFEAIYKEFDMVDLTYLLTENKEVIKQLREIYYYGNDSFNYKKIATKSEVIADLSNITNYQPIIRRVRNEVIDADNNIYFPKDNYLVAQYPRTDMIETNNMYAMEIPISDNTSNLIYFLYDNNSKAFKPKHVLSNVNLVDEYDKKLIVAKSNDSKQFLAIDYNMGVPKNIIKSSEQYNLSMATSEEDNFFNNLKVEHYYRFNNLKSVDDINNHSEYYNKVYKFIGFDGKEKLIGRIDTNRPMAIRVADTPESLKPNSILFKEIVIDNNKNSNHR